MDPRTKVTALMVRVRDGDDYYSTDLLTCWGYQGNSSFNNEALKQLARIESKGIWFNKLDPNEASKTPHPWSDYLEGSERFLRGELANPTTTNKSHVHLNANPLSYYAIAKECFRLGFFSSEEAQATFNMYGAPSKAQKPKKTLMPVPLPKGSGTSQPANLPVSSVAKVGGSSGSTAIVSSSLPVNPLPPSASAASSLTSKPLMARLKERVNKRNTKLTKECDSKTSKDYQHMIKTGPPIIPGSEVLFQGSVATPEIIVQPVSNSVVVASHMVDHQSKANAGPSIKASQSVSGKEPTQWFPAPSLLKSSSAQTKPLAPAPSTQTHIPASVKNSLATKQPTPSIPSTSSPSIPSSSSNGPKSVPILKGCSFVPAPISSTPAPSMGHLKQPVIGSARPPRKTLKISDPKLAAASQHSTSPSQSPTDCLNDSGVSELASTPSQESATPTKRFEVQPELQANPSKVSSDKRIHEMEVEINKDLDDAYGPMSNETNRRQYAYPPVVDKMGSLVSSLKQDKIELKEANVSLHREVELMTSRTKALDDFMAKKVSTDVKKMFKEEIDQKAAWVVKEVVKEINAMGNSLKEDMEIKIHNSSEGLKEDIADTLDAVLASGNSSQPQQQMIAREADLRSLISNKRPLSPAPLRPPPKVARSHDVLSYPNTVIVSSANTAVTVARSSLFECQPKVSIARPPPTQASLNSCKSH